MVKLLKIKRRGFFQRVRIFILCHALWNLGRPNCCSFEMEHATGLENCTRIYFLFTFNLVLMRIRKTSLFWHYNLMTSPWKPCISLDFSLDKGICRITLQTVNCYPFAWEVLLLAILKGFEFTAYSLYCSSYFFTVPVYLAICRYRWKKKKLHWLHKQIR